MKILADENIIAAQEAFSDFGEVRTLPAEEITADAVKHTDMLVVRSVTKVDTALLEGSRVRFVGTATIGFDHVDLDYLCKRGIVFASAPGSNANSVAEYVMSALFVLAERRAFSLADKKVGIIGCGNVGSNLLMKLEGLDVACLVNDPPLRDQTGDSRLVDLDKVIDADIVTLHVPLETDGRYPTYHMVDGDFLGKMKDGAVLINTSRGAVIDEEALEWALDSGRVSVVLDVWEKEPDINVRLLQQTELATAHIAGYSYDGKLRGTRMIYEAACRHFGVEENWEWLRKSEAPQSKLRLEGHHEDTKLIHIAVKSCYNILEDDLDLRRILKVPSEGRAEYFRDLRKNYRVRREFTSKAIQLTARRAQLIKRLSHLGFAVTN
ncbi:4-phosphoerythronate dehydrogenase [bacterium]|nr:4-phosphoerythronate dehydrogenase [bacterium]